MPLTEANRFKKKQQKLFSFVCVNVYVSWSSTLVHRKWGCAEFLGSANDLAEISPV